MALSMSSARRASVARSAAPAARVLAPARHVRASALSKTELVDAVVAKHPEVSKKVAKEVIDSAFESIVAAVAAGDRVTLVGFGTFESRARAARTGRNPQARVLSPQRAAATASSPPRAADAAAGGAGLRRAWRALCSTLPPWTALSRDPRRAAPLPAARLLTPPTHFTRLAH
jgi:DNA-binding protein HU-beta